MSDTAASDAQGSPALPSAEPVYVFKDPTTLSNWLIGVMAFGFVVGAISIFSSWMQLEFLWGVQSGAYDQGALTALAEQNDNRQRVVAGVYAVAIIASIVLFCFWIPRVSRNVRALGAKGMKISPRWAVGWYLIPIANLFMPYRAMKEIWRASKAPMAWETVKRGAILPWWWGLFLVSGMLGNMEFRLEMGATTLPQLTFSTQVSILSDIVYSIASLAAIALVREIRNMQATARGSHEAGPES